MKKNASGYGFGQSVQNIANSALNWPLKQRKECALKARHRWGLLRYLCSHGCFFQIYKKSTDWYFERLYSFFEYNLRKLKQYILGLDVMWDQVCSFLNNLINIFFKRILTFHLWGKRREGALLFPYMVLIIAIYWEIVKYSSKVGKPRYRKIYSWYCKR